MSTSEVVARWEWRAFGDIEEAAARLAAGPAQGTAESDESYLVSRDGEGTAKVRDGLMDVKRLEEVDDRGLQRWRPVLKAPSPVGADDLRIVLDAVGGGAVRSVPVHKHRTRYAILGCAAEVTEVVVAGHAVRTVAVESEDPARVMAALGALGLDPGANQSYPRALARITGLSGPRGAVIDIGTNSVKLHLGERTPDGAWRVIADRAEVVRLGEGLQETGDLSRAARARAEDAVCDMARQARRAGAPFIVAVGTAGLRIAGNSGAFVAAVRERCGVDVEVIPGDEEGRLGNLAAIAAAGPAAGGTVVVVETGGGSSQFTASTAGRVVEQFSLDLGAVTLTEEFGLDGPAALDTLARARAAAAAALGRLDDLPRPDVVVGMGGALTNLAAVERGLARYDAAVIEGTVLDRAAIDRQIELYRTMTAQERRGVVGLQPGRAEVILAGATIVGAILTALGRESLVVTDRGLRHALADERIVAG